ncbi:MAG: LysM peptidoglycan-binding domain-containing protein [Sedimentisphaerales bacterium]|jgi:nucleoid-associated protein YgaU
MQKDFKIGLAIGVTLAAGAVIWLATLPNLSARARALEAASNINPSPQIPAEVSSTPSSDLSSEVITKEENRVSSIENPDTNDQTQTANAQQQPRIHIVQKGDTLSSISAKYYGTVRQWRKIVAANRSNLPDPNHLVPGAKLIIPQ